MGEDNPQDQQAEGTGGEQSPQPGDQAAEPTSGVQEESADGDEPESDDEGEATELIPQARYDQLKGDPEKLNKELIRAANKKFREAADLRKSVETNARFLQALDADPRGTIAAVAKQMGMEVKGGDADERAEDATAQLTQAVRTALGPDYEELADRLIPAIEVVAKSVAAKAVEPYAAKVDEVITDSAARTSHQAMEAFAKSHPDWKKHEPAMVDLSRRMPPGNDMSEAEYLENIYFLVTRKTSEGDAVKRTVDRMRRSAKEGSKGETTVSSTKVAERPPKLPTFREAAAAAIAGKRFED